MTTEPQSSPDRGDPPRRPAHTPLWRYLALAVAAHAVVVLVLSPGLGRGDSDSPPALLRRARTLREEGKFDQALDLYQRIAGQKPPTPTVFTEAEKELNEVRLQGLEARRQAAQAAQQTEAAATPAAGATPAPTIDTTGVVLPALPAIGDGF